MWDQRSFLRVRTCVTLHKFRNIHFHLLPLQASKSVKLRKIDFSPVLKRIWYPGFTFLRLRIETKYFPWRIIWCQWDRHEIGCVLRKSFSPTPTQKIEYSWIEKCLIKEFNRLRNVMISHITTLISLINFSLGFSLFSKYSYQAVITS